MGSAMLIQHCVVCQKPFTDLRHFRIVKARGVTVHANKNQEATASWVVASKTMAS